MSLHVFFVSNSTCYYFTDELYCMLAAAGHEDAVLALVYYGGCSVEQHCRWARESAANYELRIIDKDGLRASDGYSLEKALTEAGGSWDVITFDNNARTFASGEMQTALAITEPWFSELFGYVKALQPDSRFLWHEVWSNEVGYNGAFRMESREQRTRVYRAKYELMHHMMKQYGIGGVPTGDAWEKVRDLPLFAAPLPEFPQAERFTLNSRIHKGEFYDDFSHDGDIGGGQYLNACVWFEILTGESCLGNPFRPQYFYEGNDVSLTEEKIAALQKAAHEAVAEHRLNK